MSKWKIILALGAVFAAGCQGPAEMPVNPVPGGADQVMTEQASVEPGAYGKPFSNGPSAPPDQSGGPTSPPPESSPAQAVTTNENIRLTLPLKTE